MDDKGGASRSFESIKQGTEVCHTYLVTAAGHGVLKDVFGDQSAIHVNGDYAKSCGFSGCVMHGAILNCFLSHFVGMVFPGHKAMLLSADIRYHHPFYMDDEIVLRAKVKQKVDTGKVVVLTVQFVRGTEEDVVAKGRVQVKVRDV